MVIAKYNAVELSDESRLMAEILKEQTERPNLRPQRKGGTGFDPFPHQDPETFDFCEKIAKAVLNAGLPAPDKQIPEAVDE